jgi:opacity protein-like surface antigen
MTIKCFFATAYVFLCALNLGWSQTVETNGNTTTTNTSAANDLFGRGRYEATLNSGVLFSPFIATGGRPIINYTLTEVQFGYMLSEVKGRGWHRGNFELVGEGFASAIFEGDGSFIAGMTIWIRYNFVPPGWRFIPYAQAGMGLTSTDIDHKIVGQPFNFNLDLGLGTRYLLSEHWALNLEYRYQHISNANSGEHNIGINAHGPMVGVSYLF